MRSADHNGCHPERFGGREIDGDARKGSFTQAWRPLRCANAAQDAAACAGNGGNVSLAASIDFTPRSFGYERLSIAT